MSAQVVSDKQAQAAPPARKKVSGLVFHNECMVAGSAMSVHLTQKNCISIKPIRFDDEGYPVALNGKPTEGWLITMQVRNSNGRMEEREAVKLNHEIKEVQYG